MKKLLFILSLGFNVLLVFQMNLAHQRLEAFRQQQAETDRRNGLSNSQTKDCE
ncbi:hypothetical protein [Furfurilactobacillus milii]|uniref:hypothetical protein n=1 Tax=Furfurilactobacillus milii TaxID=2888272 RepID=UPI00136D7DAD|nr:hypothetical protein [Furfurilactobacillus milii]